MVILNMCHLREVVGKLKVKGGFLWNKKGFACSKSWSKRGGN